MQPLLKAVWWFLKKLKLELPYDQQYHSWTYISKNVSQDTIGTLAHPLLTVAMLWDQSICPSINKWIKKMWYIYAIEYYSATKKNETGLATWIKQQSTCLAYMKLLVQAPVPPKT
jgi:hypothetical protein